RSRASCWAATRKACRATPISNRTDAVPRRIPLPGGVRANRRAKGHAMSSIALEVEPLIENLRAAVRLRDTAAIAARIKEELEDLIPAEGLRLPERFRRAHADSYCRRLLYRDPELGFTALVMTWGPGQRTALHDHA